MTARAESDIALSALETVEEFIVGNPALAAVVRTGRPTRAISVFQNTIILEAAHDDREVAGFKLVYQNPRCRLVFPSGRYMTIDFDAGRVSLVGFFVPMTMLDLSDAIGKANEVENSLERAGCMRRTAPRQGITEETIQAQVGEKSAVVSTWKMCGTASAIARISIRYNGGDYVGTSVPLGAYKATASSKQSYLVEININVDDTKMDELIKLDLRRRRQLKGSHTDPFPLAEWAAHPEWSDPTKP